MVKLKWFRSIRQDCPGWTKPAFVWFSPRWESICPMKGISKGSRWSTKLILQEQARLESRIDLQEHKLDWNPKLILQEQARLEARIDLQEQCSIGIRPHVWGTRCWCGQRWPRCVFHNGGQNQLLHLLFAFYDFSILFLIFLQFAFLFLFLQFFTFVSFTIFNELFFLWSIGFLHVSFCCFYYWTMT